MHIVKMAQTETQNLRSLSTFRTLTHMQKMGDGQGKPCFVYCLRSFCHFQGRNLSQPAFCIIIQKVETKTPSKATWLQKAHIQVLIFRYFSYE